MRRNPLASKLHQRRIDNDKPDASAGLAWCVTASRSGLAQFCPGLSGEPGRTAGAIAA